MYKIIGADGREYGPISVDQLRQWQAEGRVNAQTRVLAPGETNWKTLGELSEFAPPTGSPVNPQPIRPLSAPGMASSAPQTNGLAITGLILGIFSLVIAPCCCGGVPFNLLGLICSAIGLAQINRHPDRYNGKGIAVAGLIVSGLSVFLGIGLTIVGVALNWHEIAREFEHL